jgi:flagellar hook-basal body protein
MEVELLFYKEIKMAGIAAIGSAIGEINRSLGTGAGNIAASGADAEKGFITRYKAKVVPNGKGGQQFAGVMTKTKQRISEQGDIVGSSKSTHIAINGSGFMPVSLSGDTKEIVYTRLGDFDVDRNGNLVNSSGYALRAWKLDDLERKPGQRGNSDTRGSAETTSLDLVNVRSLTSKPKATKVISMDARLDASADTIKGAGQVFRFRSEDSFNYAIADKDVIVPSGRGMSQGDKITVKVGDSGENVDYVYGGVASSFNVKTTPILGVTDIATEFKSADFAAADKAVLGDKIRVKVGVEASVDLKFVSTTPSASKGEFNSLASLRDALNHVKGLTARISGDTLYVAAKDGSSAVTFVDVGHGNSHFVEKIGLSDIAAAAAGVKRFSTTARLRELMQDNANLRVISAEGGGLDITAKKPTDGITFTSESVRKNDIKYISATQADPATAAGARNLAKYRIAAPQNRLVEGDHVRITGLAGNAIFGGGGVAHIIPDGIYTVLAADEGGFYLAADTIINCGGAGQSRSEAVAAGATWQKVTGSSSATYPAAAGSTASIANGANTMTLDIGAFNGAGHALSGLAANDVVYISGLGAVDGHEATVSVPDGYYRVAAVNAAVGTFQIQTYGNAANANLAAAAGVAVGHGFNITKIGTSGGDEHTVTESATFSNPGGTTLRVNMRNHSFNIDDYVSLGGGINGAVDNKIFKIISATDEYFDIELETPADAAAVALLPMPAAAYIDFRGKLDENIGFRQDKDGTVIDAVYSPTGGEGRNLATATFDGIWEQSIVTYDDLGVPHNLRIAFAKVGIREWAVQVYAIKDPITAEYPVTGTTDGILASGTIFFDGQGAIQSIDGINREINLNWRSGSSPTSIKLNFGQTADDKSTSIFTNGGLKHVKGDNEVFSLEQDGYAPGKFIGLSVDAETGSLIASYDNGQTQAVYKIPVCYFAAEDGMEPVGSATFKATFASGDVVLKDSGDDGVGRYTGSAKEQSNIIQVEEMSDLVQNVQLLSLNASALSSVIKSQEEFIRRT